MQRVRHLIVVLGDQLTPTLSSLSAADPSCDRVLMAELHDEATYVPHHKKKIAFLFSAMRHFAEELRAAGWAVDYVKLGSPDNQPSFTAQVAHAIAAHRPERIRVTEPGEWRVLQEIRGWEALFSVPVDVLPDDRFVCSAPAFRAWANSRTSLRMEYFYREMRRQTGLLMDGDAPAGGKWNFDSENRKTAPDDLFMPRPKAFEPDAITREVLSLVEARFGHHFGDLTPFWFGVTRADAEAAFAGFVDRALPQFGDYQDAMLKGEPFLYHAVISQYLNCGLLDPLRVCRRVEAAFRSGCVPLNILGLGVANPAAVDYVLGDPYRDQVLEQKVAGVNLSITPFATWAGDVSFAQPKVGHRTLDFNTEGLAHIGLLPDFIEDVRRDGVSDADLEPLFRSAEAYIRMWEKAERRAAEIGEAGPVLP